MLGCKRKLLVFRHELGGRSEAIGLEMRRVAKMVKSYALHGNSPGLYGSSLIMRDWDSCIESDSTSAESE